MASVSVNNLISDEQTFKASCQSILQIRTVKTDCEMSDFPGQSYLLVTYAQERALAATSREYSRVICPTLDPDETVLYRLRNANDLPM